jgi:hypothetical protein
MRCFTRIVFTKDLFTRYVGQFGTTQLQKLPLFVYLLLFLKYGALCNRGTYVTVGHRRVHGYGAVMGALGGGVVNVETPSIWDAWGDWHRGRTFGRSNFVKLRGSRRTDRRAVWKRLLHATVASSVGIQWKSRLVPDDDSQSRNGRTFGQGLEHPVLHRGCAW